MSRREREIEKGGGDKNHKAPSITTIAIYDRGRWKSTAQVQRLVFTTADSSSILPNDTLETFQLKLCYSFQLVLESFSHYDTITLNCSLYIVAGHAR